MQSPFKLFRKYQKLMLGVLAVGAMLIFGVGDVLTQMGRSGGRAAAQGSVVVESRAGSLTQAEIADLQRRRKVANFFVLQAFIGAHPEMERFPNMLRNVEQRFGGSSPREVVIAWLLRQEAKRMGIIVDDEQVRRFIDLTTSRKLSSSQFDKIVKNLQISPKALFDILRDELTALLAYRMSVPIAPQSPEQYWDLYQQIHTRQTIEVAPLPIKDFAKLVEVPADAILQKFFEAHKSDFEMSSGGEYKPGFRQPPKVKLQYLELPYETVEAQVLKESPISDKEIEEYYETNKDIDLRLQEPRVESPASPGVGSETSPVNPEFAPDAGEAPQGPGLTPPSDEKPAPQEPSEKPAEPAADNDAAPEKPAENPCGALPQEAETPAEAATQPAAEKPTPPETPTEETTPAAESPDQEATEENATEKKVEESESDADAQPASPKKSEAPKVRYKPLDDELRGTIRDSLIRERTLKRVRELSAKASDALKDAGLRFARDANLNLARPKKEELARLAEAAQSEMQKVAERFGLKYGETRLVSQFELSELEGIGKARELDSDPFGAGSARSVVDQAFEGESLCRAFLVQDADTNNAYVFWKIEDVPAHIPTFDEAGIKEQVAEAWKLKEALPLAKQRAEKLSERVRQSDKGMSVALGGETVTGEAKGAAVKVSESPEFSWWRESFAPMTGGRQPPVQLGNPIVVSVAGPTFMQSVFNDLKAGEVGPVVNDDASVYYIVKVVERRPADREKFKDAALFSPFSSYGALVEREQQITRGEYSRQLEESYKVKWHDVEEDSFASNDE